MFADLLSRFWFYTHLRDPFSALSHLAACFASFYVIFLFLKISRGDLSRRLALLAFGCGLALLFAASATYHALILPPEPLRMLQMIDQSAIYILIAGTYTPTLYLVLPPGWVKTASLSAVWTLAVAGIICKWALLSPPYWLVVAPYIALGWFGTLVYHRLHRVVSYHGMKWVVLGGLSYSIGAVFDWQQWPTLSEAWFGPHELFHVLVILGAFCHILFVVKYAAAHRDHPPRA